MCKQNSQPHCCQPLQATAIFFFFEVASNRNLELCFKLQLPINYYFIIKPFILTLILKQY